MTQNHLSQSAKSVEYTDGISVEELDLPYECRGHDTKPSIPVG